MYSHAQILAFLYAGALDSAREQEIASLKDRGIAIDLWDDHEGHRGFVANCEPLARQIADHLNLPCFAEVEHPGVVEYEVIEPLGKWLLENPQRRSTDAFDYFVVSYGAWLTS